MSYMLKITNNVPEIVTYDKIVYKNYISINPKHLNLSKEYSVYIDCKLNEYIEKGLTKIKESYNTIILKYDDFDRINTGFDLYDVKKLYEYVKKV